MGDHHRGHGPHHQQRYGGGVSFGKYRLCRQARRNPDIAVVVLVEHGGWGAEASAPLAARVIEAFVDKQRRLDNNLQEATTPAKKVEVGAVWSEQPEQVAGGAGAAKATVVAAKDAAPAMHGGHFTVPAQ
jgi:penicillin-binding protein 2